MTELYLARHGEVEKLESDSTTRDSTFAWKLSSKGRAQMEALGDYCRQEGIVFSEAVFGSQYRMGQSLRKMAITDSMECGEGAQQEDYLNSRVREIKPESRQGEKDLLLGDSPNPVPFIDYIRNSAERLLERVKRRAELFTNAKLLFITSQELIVALRFRLHGTPIEQKYEVLSSLQRGDEVNNKDSVAHGEMLVFSNIDPESGKEYASFRWEKRINPSNPARHDEEWQHFRVKRYTQIDLDTRYPD